MGNRIRRSIKTKQGRMRKLFLDLDGATTGEREISTVQTIADVIGVAEVSTIETIADTGAKEVTVITCAAGGAAAQGDYFIIRNAAGARYAVWLDIDAAGTAPTGAAYTAAENKIEVDILSTDTDIEVAGKVFAATGSMTNLTRVDNADGTITYTSSLMGVITDAERHNENDSGNGSFGVSVSTQGAASNLNSKYFVINTALDAISYYVWINVNSQGVDPAVAGKTAVPIAVAAGASADTIASAIQVALDALAGFAASVVTDTVTVTNASTGATTDIADGGAATGFTLGVTTQGVTAVDLGGRYFSLADAAGSVAVWIDVGNTDAEPSHGKDRAIEVDITAGDSADTVANKVKLAIDADAAFSASVVGSTVTVTDAAEGPRTNIAANTSGFTVGVSTQGVTSAIDIVEGDFDCALAEGSGPGDYTITFNEAFAATPAVVPTLKTAQAIAQVHTVSASSVRIQTFDAADGTTAKNAQFQLMILGKDA